MTNVFPFSFLYHAPLSRLTPASPQQQPPPMDVDDDTATPPDSPSVVDGARRFRLADSVVLTRRRMGARRLQGRESDASGSCVGAASKQGWFGRWREVGARVRFG